MNPSLEFLNDEIWLSFRLETLIPSMRTWPFVGLSKSPIILSNVDLPEPELPTIKMNSPFFTENETFFKA